MSPHAYRHTDAARDARLLVYHVNRRSSLAQPNHLTRPETGRLTSIETPRLADAAGRFLCYTEGNDARGIAPDCCPAQAA